MAVSSFENLKLIDSSMLLYEKKNIITLSHIHTEKERDENLCSHPLLHSPNVCNDQDLTISSLLEEPEAAQSECGK